MLNPNQTEKSKSILKELQSSSDVSINDEGLIEINNTPTAIDASNFLFTLQQPTKKLYHPDYKRILDKIKISPDLVPNSEAKEIVKPKAKLEKMYTSGPAAYGSARNLQATSKMPKAKIDTFLQQ